jgi:hypothetical protein
MKAKAAVERHVDSLLYIYYNEPGHRISKEFDKDLTSRTRYLGIELSDEEWIDQIRTLVKLECLEEEEASRQLDRGLSDLFDRLGRDLDLMSRVIPAIVKKIGDIKPKIPFDKPLPPDYQKIIDTIFMAHRDQWISRDLVRDWFNDSTQIKNYTYVCSSTDGIDAVSMIRNIFDTEYERYIRRTSSNLMMLKIGERNHYRRFPEGMVESDFYTLQIFQSSEILNEYIQLVISPPEHNQSSIRKLDILIENILIKIGEVKRVKVEHDCLRTKKKRAFLENNLALSEEIIRRLKFYAAETQSEPMETMLIQNISRQIILELARIYGSLGDSPKYYSCFISYGEPDKKFALKLRNALNNTGINCWAYASDATVGEQTWQEITRKRHEAEKMILLCSIRSLSRDGVKKEIEAQIDEDESKIIPISLDDDWKNEGFEIRRGQNDLKPMLLRKNYADFSDESNFDSSLTTLKKALKKNISPAS